MTDLPNCYREGPPRYFLSMSGTSPNTSETMHWGAFRKKESDTITWKQIDVETLLEILRFERHPTSLAKQPFRRHHTKKRMITITETMPLGFDVERTLIVRS